MGDPIKFVNFYFPDNTHAVISMEDKPICKTTHLPQQQPLIFGHNLGPNFREHKFIYQPVCKVGCKTIKTWMLSLLQPDTVMEAGGERNYGDHIESSHLDNGIDFNIHDSAWEIFGGVGIEREEVIDGKRLLRVNQSLIKIMNKHNFEFADEVADYFKFTFVRNPWSRMVSAYMEKFRDSKGLRYQSAITINGIWGAVMAAASGPIGQKSSYFKEHLHEYIHEDGVMTFKAFVDVFHQFSKQESLESFDIHWLPQYIINDMYIKKYDFIGKLENFENDFDKILETLNINVKPKYKIGSNSHLYQKHIEFYKNDPELIDKVAEIYKEDIERYGYDFSDLENAQ